MNVNICHLQFAISFAVLTNLDHCIWYALEQHLEFQTMLHRWDLGRPQTSKNEKYSRPNCQMDDTDGWFRHPWRLTIV